MPPAVLMSSDDEPIECLTCTPNEMLFHGLVAVGHTEQQLRRKNLSRNTKEDSFISHHGINSYVCAQVFEDLQLAPSTHDQLDPSKANLRDLFCTLYFLKCCQRQRPNASRFSISTRTARDIIWEHIQMIRGLLPFKICWPDDDFGDAIWAMSVDGTHFRSQEKRDNEAGLNLDPKIFSFKHNCAGFNCEIGFSLSESRCVWLSGPHDAGTCNDIRIFSEKGLAEKLRRSGKKAVGDSGHVGCPKLVSTPNNRHDLPEARKFKSRARLRHERFNAMLKTFDCIGDGLFRHSKEKLGWCVESAAVLVQCKMEFGEPLYDI